MGDAVLVASDRDSDGSIRRDSEVWFEDGNIVVIAQNTAFRIHKSVVSVHSSVFRDLFSIPQPSLTVDGVNVSFDGCRVVRVSDTSYDFRELLRAIYYGGVSNVHPDQAMPFPVLAALGRLSHKYQLDQLLAGVIRRMKDTFTTQLDVWDPTQASGFCSAGSSLRLELELEPSDAIEALNLIRLLDRPEMIPTAVFGCCQESLALLLQGTTRRGDGVTAERLSPSDLELCFKVERKLGSDDSDCLSPAKCLDSLKVVLDKCHEDLRDCIFPDPFDTYYIGMLESLAYCEELCRKSGGVFQDSWE
ncbi:hypothetical protein GSI_09540 [Ganoderma sinense ZZ0214-1]|uniref:BTB domain-containing protein n=1 Tax=Ganoderma sinense ZZ0214-1 TaxID=1077348 RepID=A0A2G8S3N7_9APHY|nr:hypothetical protein GSI_09540 [Ganoderma sinense ZZ0214-1]